MHRPHHRDELTDRIDRPRATLARRTFLVDLGRVTLGAVVLGPVLAACSDDDTTDPGGGGDATGSEPADGGTARGEDSGTAEGDPVTWARARMGFVSAYVVVRDGEALVFDTGQGEDVAPIAAALEEAGVTWSDVGDVIVSHRHGDHVGGLVDVITSASNAVTRGAAPDLDAFRDRVDRVEEVADGDTVLGLRIVATPGHTLGHVSAFDEGTGLLLAGDAIVNGVQVGGTSGDGIEASPPDFTEDEAQALASVGVLADLRPATILFGHGDPLTDDAATLLSDYAETL